MSMVMELRRDLWTRSSPTAWKVYYFFESIRDPSLCTLHGAVQMSVVKWLLEPSLQRVAVRTLQPSSVEAGATLAAHAGSCGG